MLKPVPCTLDASLGKRGFRWMDSDMHLCEPVDLWDAYIEPAYKDFAPRWTGTVGQDHPLRNNPYFTLGEAMIKSTEADPNNPDDVIRERRFHVFQPYMAERGDI